MTDRPPPTPHRPARDLPAPPFHLKPIVLRSDAPRADVAEFVRQLASVTRNPHLARVAASLGKPGGRPPADDADALCQVAWLIESGAATSVEAAARYVARTLDGEHSQDAAATRLARKFRRQKPPHKTT
ncbi:hypothetical protein [Limobrevibacterium gyesilva]|uniref:Uncharacterized protein n=1 Tax=Limobrevibacterium gyesilva TaxID=2991712 RepID=A0AA41YTL7_9PROT|nr:hypothetical protein [Limobrevibacterium gyesilva]MCW3476333.1 hypothetical protein [Limobrevibacterium gyesilva]